MNVPLLICVFSAFYTGGAEKKPKLIDYQNQKGGDILDLRSNTNGPMLNALRPRSPNKWTKYSDGNGNYIIPYIIRGRYDSEDMRIILDSMEKLSANTCIRFKERSNEEDYVEIKNMRNGGCYSNVGRPFTGVNQMNLESNYESTCLHPRIVTHELMHVIGLWHEHAREDRDNYIRVHFENVQGGYGGEDYKMQFAKLSSIEASTYGIPYDYTSIMHYAKDFFAKPGTVTMETLDPNYQDIIGTVNEPSENDYKKICLIYNCGHCMSKKMSAADHETEEPNSQQLQLAPHEPQFQITELCYDQDPLQCMILKTWSGFDCQSDKYRRLCCATCETDHTELLNILRTKPKATQPHMAPLGSGLQGPKTKGGDASRL